MKLKNLTKAVTKAGATQLTSHGFQTDKYLVQAFTNPDSDKVLFVTLTKHDTSDTRDIYSDYDPAIYAKSIQSVISYLSK